MKPYYSPAHKQAEYSPESLALNGGKDIVIHKTIVMPVYSPEFSCFAQELISTPL